MDLDELIRVRCADTPPALVGESWGAMLALAYAAAHPQRVCAIVLVGCGTFDKVSRLQMRRTLDERMDDDLRNRLDQLEHEVPDPEVRLAKRYELTKTLYDVDPVDPDQSDDETPPVDIRAHTETWNDMVRLQEEGVYPAAFAAIKAPILMLHGAYDPHPGGMIRASLSPYLPQIEYREWARCGHSPWLERAVRDEFFDVMRSWLHARFAERA
jgi:pimeloyl-ACP methyl ester carboxylesterase